MLSRTFSRRSLRCTIGASVLAAVGLSTLTALPAAASSGSVIPSSSQSSVVVAPIDSERPGDADGNALIVNDASSTVPVRALGSAKTAATAQGLRAAPSDLQATGRWVSNQQKITVVVPEGAEGYKLGIGLEGHYNGINNCRWVGIYEEDLKPGVNTITAPHQGLVYVMAGSSTMDSVVTVSGGKPTPTFIKGVSTKADFEAQLDRWDAPMMSIISDHVQIDAQRFSDFPGQFVRNEEKIRSVNLESLVDNLDLETETAANISRVSLTGHKLHAFGALHFSKPGDASPRANDGFIDLGVDYAARLFSSAVVDSNMQRAIALVFPEKTTAPIGAGVEKDVAEGKIQIRNVNNQVAGHFAVSENGVGLSIARDLTHGKTPLNAGIGSATDLSFSLVGKDGVAGTKVTYKGDENLNRDSNIGAWQMADGAYVVVESSTAGRLSFKVDGQIERNGEEKQAFKRVGKNLVPVSLDELPVYGDVFDQGQVRVMTSSNGIAGNFKMMGSSVTFGALTSSKMNPAIGDAADLVYTTYGTKGALLSHTVRGDQTVLGNVKALRLDDGNHVVIEIKGSDRIRHKVDGVVHRNDSDKLAFKRVGSALVNVPLSDVPGL
jgi:hypothetical protein